eukprot:364809-Chlamydomonas_euryale.AAC.10
MRAALPASAAPHSAMFVPCSYYGEPCAVVLSARLSQHARAYVPARPSQRVRTFVHAPAPIPLLPPFPPPRHAAQEQLYQHLGGKIARFAVPDDIVFVPEIPHNATGKVSKLTLREMYKSYTPTRPRL